MDYAEKYFQEKKRKFFLVLAFLSVLLTFTFIFSLNIGSSNVGLLEILTLMSTSSKTSSTLINIVYNLRLPRTLAAMFIGVLLAISGVLIQSVTRNSLAEPFLLGLSSGALTFMALAIIIVPSIALSLHYVSVISFIGALIAFTLTLTLSEAIGGSATSLILAGLAVTAGFSGLSSFLAFIVQSKLNMPFLILLLGSLSQILRGHVVMLALVSIAGFTLALIMAKRLNAIIYGDEHALQLGYNPKTVRIFASMLAALLTSVSVAIAGIIGFIGLIVPHMSRLIIGSDNRYVVPLSALLGALVLCVSDIFVRIASEGLAIGEIPVGAVTSVLGAPFFAYLLLTKVKA